MDTEDGPLCLACNEERIAFDFDFFVITKDDLETGNWKFKVVQLGGHQRPISPLFEIVKEFGAVASYSDAPTSIDTVVSTMNELLDSGEDSFVLARTNSYQFCTDVALVRRV